MQLIFDIFLAENPKMHRIFGGHPRGVSLRKISPMPDIRKGTAHRPFPTGDIAHFNLSIKLMTLPVRERHAGRSLRQKSSRRGILREDQVLYFPIRPLGLYGSRENQMNFFLLMTRTAVAVVARTSRTMTLIMETSAVEGTPAPLTWMTPWSPFRVKVTVMVHFSVTVNL